MMMTGRFFHTVLRYLAVSISLNPKYVSFFLLCVFIKKSAVKSVMPGCPGAAAVLLSVYIAFPGSCASGPTEVFYFLYVRNFVKIQKYQDFVNYVSAYGVYVRNFGIEKGDLLAGFAFNFLGKKSPASKVAG